MSKLKMATTAGAMYAERGAAASKSAVMHPKKVASELHGAVKHTFKKHPYVTDFTVGGIAANAAWDAGKAGYVKTKERAQNKHPRGGQ